MKFTLEVSQEMVANLFCSALEGGYSPWLYQADLVEGTYEKKDNLVWWGHDEVFKEDLEFRLIYDENDEGTFGGDKVFTWEDLERGMAAMFTKAPKHLCDIGREETDALTADAFMQCVVFGDLIYG